MGSEIQQLQKRIKSLQFETKSYQSQMADYIIRQIGKPLTDDMTGSIRYLKWKYKDRKDRYRIENILKQMRSEDPAIGYFTDSLAGVILGSIDFVSERWRTSTVVDIARSIRKTNDPSLLPILADALEDARCDDEDILRLLRTANTNTFYSLKISNLLRALIDG